MSLQPLSHVMNRPILISLTSTLLFLLPSCLPEQSTSQATPTDTAPPPAEEVVWAWQDFAEATTLTLGTLPVAVHPRQSLEIKAEASGIITLYIDQKVSNVTAGKLWAEMNSERLASKQERLNIQTRKQSLNNMKAEQLDLPEREAEAYEKLQEAQRKVKLLEHLMKSKAMDKMTDLLGVNREDVSATSLQKAREALALAERKMEFAQKFDHQLREDEKRLAEMDMIESQNQFREAKSQSEYIVPFDGELRLNLGLIPDQQHYTVMSRETLGVLSDYSEIHAYLSVNNASWIALQPESLHLRLKDRARTELTFLQDRYIKNSRGKEERNYIFRITGEENSDLRRLTGSTLDADLVHSLSQPCRIVPKLELSLYAMERSDSREWDAILADLFPGAQLIAEGLEHLAIALPAPSSSSTQPVD